MSGFIVLPGRAEQADLALRGLVLAVLLSACAGNPVEPSMATADYESDSANLPLVGEESEQSASPASSLGERQAETLVELDSEPAI